MNLRNAAIKLICRMLKKESEVLKKSGMTEDEFIRHFDRKIAQSPFPVKISHDDIKKIYKELGGGNKNEKI